jgi:hypothetical protein
MDAAKREDEWTIVPRSHCVIVASGAARNKPTLIELQQRQQQPTRSLTTQQAILQHLESMGKHLILLEAAQTTVVSCLWGDGKWYEAVTCNTMPSPKVLREHLKFENCQGNYYCVQWKENNSYSLIPVKLSGGGTTSWEQCKFSCCLHRENHVSER